MNGKIEVFARLLRARIGRQRFLGTETAPVAAPREVQLMRILIVDDSATMRRIIRNNVKAMGYEAVVEADNGESALARLKAEPVDFVIADWAMPVMNGLELVRAIRSSPTHARLPVLMITAAGQEEDILEAIQAEVSGYIVKPFEPDTLKTKINQILTGAVKA
jgi:two-component system, chemotaxis family, chemotaxis protein CheY